MTVKRVWMAFLVGCAVAACAKDKGGTITQPPPLAGLRYFNLVADTGAMDIRLVDIFAYAPNTVNAVFRTGGNPMGVATNLPPPYWPVQAGSHHIRAFMTSANIAVDTLVMLDTTTTFVQGHNYTVYVYGYARTGSTPHTVALITDDVVPTIPAGNIAVRVVNLASTLAAGADAYVGVQDTVALVAANRTVAATAFPGASAYVNVPVGAKLAAFTAGGTTTPVLFQGNMTAGVVGTTTNCPSSDAIGGTLVAGTALTMLIAPPSVAGSAAPQSSGAGAIASVVLAGSTATVTTVNNHGLASNAIVRISGATPAAYNGSFVIKSTGAKTFTYQVYGNPGAVTVQPVFRAAAGDYANPNLVFLIDQPPPRVCP